MLRSLILFLGAALAACAHSKIPNTEIEDTSDTRAILDVMEKYRIAVEARDPTAIAVLVDPSFKDDGGSSNPDDDLDYSTLTQKLGERFGKVDAVKLDLDIRKINVADDAAQAVYHYNTRYVLLQANNSKLQKSDSDIKQMAFKRVSGQWRITSGI